MPAAALHRWVVVALMLAAGLPAAAQSGPGPAAESASVERYERTVPLRAGSSFSLSNINGSISVEGWNRDEAQIIAVKSSSRGLEEFGQVGIVIRQLPEGISVETRYLRDGGAEVSVDYHVRVPLPVRLSMVSTVNGSVTVRNVTGSGTLVAINGNVNLFRAAGFFSARATNGNIGLELLSLDAGGAADAGRPAAAPPGISVQTVNGSIVVALPQDASAEVDARTQHGEFSSEIPLLAETSTSGRAARGRVGAGGPALVLRTVNGSIRLRIAGALV